MWSDTLMTFRYLLRLGMGEQELATDMDFSRVGRVNAMLARRLELLAEVRHSTGLSNATLLQQKNTCLGCPYTGTHGLAA